MKHIMLDLETMGTDPGCIALSIGACLFDREGILDRFYTKLDFVESSKAGFTIDPKTVKWWLEQADEARREVFKDPVLPSIAMDSFKHWLPNANYFVWGNGAMFDNAIIKPYFIAAHGEVPWTHRHDKCYRTIASSFSDEIEREGIHHQALDDACSQAYHLIMLNNKYNLNLL
jgi:hypothetical protein